ncbi:Apoptotic chromatin condensation inducer in the nucleus [Quillaja saponaria]|uniref:Apoptotic chromatin condensation inducer in the nucleus n=1 Tax=Quillaja saponaria TaxID=32244 RepID=A0AAD7LEW1_QUISA|nr:Apoptotic chromatin condensation inducer in the nucleus [Quillaja saponaria]
MSSRYPVLDNRPIDQWKVIELKEELRRRKLTTKGLKDDLIKRLDEALRIQREAAEKESTNGFDCDPQSVAGAEDAETVPVVTETVDKVRRENTEIVGSIKKDKAETIEKYNAESIKDVVGQDSSKNEPIGDVTAQVDINKSATPMEQEKVEQKDLPSGTDSVGVGEELVAHRTSVETSITITETVLSEIVFSGQDSQDMVTEKNEDSTAKLENEAPTARLDNEDSIIKLQNQDSKTKLENEDSKPWVENEDSKHQMGCDTKPLCEDVLPGSSVPENQVSEVNPILGSQVKSDSISTDSVSINEKIELKDNIIADNVKLEQDILRPEMVEPSSSNIVPVFGDSHPMDVEEADEKKASVEEKDVNNSTSPDLNKTNNSEDVGYPEKLNLDRSSGDDSMEEDLVETKQFDSKDNSDDLRDGGVREVPITNVEIGTNVVGDGFSVGNTDIHVDNNIHPIVSAEKRKFHDQVAVGNNEPSKRRRWNSETVKVPDPQNSNLTHSTTPKDKPATPPAFKRNFFRSESSVSDDATKERVVPPSQQPPTNSLRIDHFRRPLTLKAVQELLGKTGCVISFWMDQIKTHCYVTYSSVEEAIETRNAVYNLQWPPNGGRLLVAEFVDSEEVKMKLEPPPTQAVPVKSGPTVPPAPIMVQPEPSPRQQRQQLPPPPNLPPPPPLFNHPPAARERLPSPPPLPEQVDPPIMTLDDLFRKTKATPRIYYLPLSEEQVAAKLALKGSAVTSRD